MYPSRHPERHRLSAGHLYSAFTVMEKSGCASGDGEFHCCRYMPVRSDVPAFVTSRGTICVPPAASTVVPVCATGVISIVFGAAGLPPSLPPPLLPQAACPHTHAANRPTPLAAHLRGAAVHSRAHQLHRRPQPLYAVTPARSGGPMMVR